MYGNAPSRSNTALVATLGIVCALLCVVMGFKAPPRGGALRPERFKQIRVDPLPIPAPSVPPLTLAGEPCWSRGRTVNIRSGPSTRKSKVKSVTDGTPLRCLDEQKRWHHVRVLNGSKGWIRGDLLVHDPPDSYRTQARTAEALADQGDHVSALLTWAQAVEFGQEDSEAAEILPDALARAALKRANDRVAGRGLIGEASVRNRIVAVLPCEDGKATEEAVYTMYRALEVSGVPDATPTFLVTEPDRVGPWAAIHLERFDVHGRGGRLEVQDDGERCELRMVMTVSWHQTLNAMARMAVFEGAAVGRYLEVEL